MSQPVKASLLSVGSSPPVVFLCSRLQASRGYDISIAWPEISSRDDRYSVISDKFGSTTFQADHVFDLADLASIRPPTKPSPPSRSLDPREAPASSTTTALSGFDIVLITLSNLRQVSRIAKNLAPTIVPNHTIILLDTSSGLPPLRNLLTEKFPHNPVMSVILSDSRIFRTLSANPCIVHKTSNTTAILDYSALGLFSTSKSVSDLLFNIQSAGVDIAKPQDQTAFLQSLWQRCIPTLAYGPLSIILDVPDISKLQQDILARPIYQGVINELLELARSQGCSMPDSDYFDNIDLVRSLNMYNDFYNKLPIPIDVLLLQPILLADEFGLKTPYLESLFAFFSHLNMINSEAGKSALFQRVSARAYDHGREEALWKKEQALLAKEQSLLAKEQALFHREQAVVSRESGAYSATSAQGPMTNGTGCIPPPPGPLPPNSRRYRPPSVLSSVAGSPPGVGVNGVTNGMNGIFSVNGTNGHIVNGGNGYSNGVVPQSPYVGSNSSGGDIDMMSMTNRRSRRSLVRSLSVASSLSTTPKPPGTPMPGHRMSSPALSTMGFQPFSQNMNLDEVARAEEGRYGGFSNGLASKPRRLSSNFSALPSGFNAKVNGNGNANANANVNMSRSNSFVMNNNALFSISPTAPTNSRYSTANSLDGPQLNGNGNGNGNVNGYYKSSSSSSPSTTPSNGSK
jgi:ketopantoate reductase